MSPKPRFARNRPTSREGAASVALNLADSCERVLGVIRRKRGATIAEIARALRMEKSSVSARISQLRDDLNLIVDSGKKRATPGITRVAGIIWKERTERDAQMDLLEAS